MLREVGLAPHPCLRSVPMAMACTDLRRTSRPRRGAAKGHIDVDGPTRNDLRLLPCKLGQMLPDVTQCTRVSWVQKVIKPGTNRVLHLLGHLAYVEGDISLAGSNPVMGNLSRQSRLDEAVTLVATSFRIRSPL